MTETSAFIVSPCRRKSITFLNTPHEGRECTRVFHDHELDERATEGDTRDGVEEEITYLIARGWDLCPF